MPTTGHGKDIYVATGTAGSESNISTYVSSIEWPWEYDDADISAAGVAYKQNTPGQYGSEVKIEGPWSTELHAILQPLRGVTGKSVIYGPRGNTSGYYKLSATGWWEYSPPTGDIGDALRYEATFHVSSANTEGTF